VNEITGSGIRRESSPPSPSIDRAALSEAWYRALYGTKPSARESHVASPVAQARSLGADASARPASAPAAGRAPLAVSANSCAVKRQTPAVGSVSRLRPSRQPLTAPGPARVADTEPARRTLCRVALPEGNVEILVQQRGRRLHVVALAEGAAAGRVAAALQRARAAIIAHGLRPDCDCEVKGPT
jgi:hypothetical protein